MRIEQSRTELLWQCYQAGYAHLMRSGAFFGQILRPGISHLRFHRALPLLQEYAASNNRHISVGPSFDERLDACAITPRDLLHLDFAICLGYAQLEGCTETEIKQPPVLAWPGPNAQGGLFVADDAILESGLDLFDDDELPNLDDFDADDDPRGGGSSPPFDV